MTTAAVIAAACILVAGLFAVIVERTNERDEARANADQWAAQAETFADELAAANVANDIATATIARLRGDVLDLRTRLSDALNGGAERAPLAAVVPIEGLRVVEDVPVADESWLDEITKPGGWV